MTSRNENIATNNDLEDSESAVEDYLENNSPSILIEEGDLRKYIAFFILSFGFFVLMYYFWHIMFTKCIYLDRYHDSDQ